MKPPEDKRPPAAPVVMARIFHIATALFVTIAMMFLLNAAVVVLGNKTMGRRSVRKQAMAFSLFCEYFLSLNTARTAPLSVWTSTKGHAVAQSGLALLL